MRIKSHVMIGIASWVGYSLVVVQNPIEPYQLILAMLGAALPDIDHPGSWLGKRALPISAPIWLIFGHRTFTHSALPVAMGVAALYTFPEQAFWLLPLLVGYISHLAADFFSDGGIPVFYPSQKRFKFPVTVTTGGLSEVALVTLLMVAFVVAVYVTLGVSGLKEISMGVA